ncbi:unnamed protein product [Strongylus vulgaris]|uniref:Pre-mRNA-splicing factor SLU7 n=1 Tax=Strongylus vulgaris TaxID=40348 RepID=A0A3P7J789_STRVU|nr:unnamed protein product [Strongylus vulgaris]
MAGVSVDMDSRTRITALLSKYGGAEYLESTPKELLFAQTEQYVEYSRKGKVLKGAERAPIKSRYEEDNSYCLKEEGLKAEQAEPAVAVKDKEEPTAVIVNPPDEKPLIKPEQNVSNEASSSSDSGESSSSSSSESEDSEKEREMERERERSKFLIYFL